MSNSLPSRKAVILDLPQAKNFRASFVYNFFTTDESVNDTGEVPDDVKTLPAESFDSARIENIRRIVPRLVRFDFIPVNLQGDSLSQNEFVQHPNPAGSLNPISIADNLAQIQAEEQFAASDYTGFSFQDNNVDRKLFTLVSGSMAKRVAAKNRSIQQQIDVDQQTVLSSLPDQYSLTDAAKAMASETSPGVSDNVVINALAQIDKLKLSFIDDASQQELVDTEFDEVRKVAIRGQVSNRIVGRVIRNIVNDPMSIYADEFSQVRPRADAEQIRAIARFNPRQITATEFETLFHPITTKPVDAHDFPSSTRILGYVIEKFEILANGQLKQHPPIILENAAIGTAVDLNVAYGRTYIYTIRVVAQLDCRASVEDTDDIVIGSGLVSSPRSPRSFVTCTENVPPPPPADFNVIWDYNTALPLLVWSFPPNTQRDIKKFQVFRRGSVNEPFQLMRQIDFDDSVIKTTSAETPDPALIDVLNDPMTTFLDVSFTPDLSPIYALCSIDAHGLSSGYSMQIQVRFDTNKNRINKQIISFGGAPKSYPNMQLNADLFTNVMKVSGHVRARIIFDPEFLRVTDTSNNDLRLIAAHNIDGSKYQLQIINTDVQQEEVVDVVVNDMRLVKARSSLNLKLTRFKRGL